MRKRTQAILAGAEPWSSAGHGELGHIGVVLSHGITGSPISMRWVAEQLAARGFAVEVPRLPGHGTSWRDMARTTYDDWRQEVPETVDELSARTSAVVLGGLSMGGTLALDIGWQRERKLAGLVAINATVLPREGVLAKLAPVLKYVVPIAPSKAAGLVANDAARPGVDERAYAMLPSGAASSFLQVLPRVRRQLTQLRLPVLVAYSPEDHSVPAANSRAILKALGSYGEELVLERSYHLATMDLDRELLVERIAAFAERTAGERLATQASPARSAPAVP